PEVSVVQSGALLDAQVVVSDDRRYVTINTRADHTKLLALEPFPIIVESLGFVGGAGGGGATGGGGGMGGAGGARSYSPVQTSPSEILKIDPTAANSVLRKQGMFLIKPVN
ncbi:MAG: hypothetical protein ACREJC_17940, partial [Tepidisphaeraceae bacterium]